MVTASNRIGISLGLLACGFLYASLHGQGAARLLRPGIFFIEPPRILPTEQWFGLRRDGSGWSLIRVTPNVVLAEALCGPHATAIAAKGHDNILVLLAGLPRLSAGPVDAEIGAPRFVYPGEAIDVGTGYTLAAFGTAVPSNDDVIFENYTLWIRYRRERQLLASFERNGFQNPRQIVWAGDIDRDARPDFLFDFPLGDVGHNYVLFLSSLRDGHQLVSEAASFTTPGC